MPGSSFSIPLPRGFDLARAVCSYGYFILAPNRWDPKTQRLHRPLRGAGDRVTHTTLVQEPLRLRVLCGVKVARGEKDLLMRQVSRMLRLDDDPAIYRAWNRVYPEARRARFGRMFRSPTLFEDMVKTITGCNVAWQNTMTMNRLLCERVGGGAFPTPAELAACRPAWVQSRCKVGYRAERIVRLARDVRDGRLDLARFEDASTPTAEVFEAIKEIHGFGDYAAGNVCQLLGRYDRLAIDTETYRHFEQEHRLPRGDNPELIHPRIEKHYARYAPFQFLAYWFDLWRGYERRFGPARRWDAERDGKNFTAARLKEM